MDKNQSFQTGTPRVECKVEVERVNFFNEENGFSVLTAKSLEDHQSFIAIGAFAMVEAGEYLNLSGQWQLHKSFGRQFKVEKAVSIRPQSRQGIVRYLSSGLFKGLGEKTANKLVKEFGLETFKILDEDPERLKLLPKLGKRTASKIISAWDARRCEHETLMFLYRHGIVGATARKLKLKYGDETLNQISSNPFRLIKEVRGIGFATSDKIAQSIGLELDHPQRIQEGILHLLSLAEDQGHCYLTNQQLREGLLKTLGLSQIQVEASFESNLLVLEEELRLSTCERTDPDGEIVKCHFLQDLLASEKGVADAVLTILGPAEKTKQQEKSATLLESRAKKWIHVYCEKSGTPLSQEQQQAVLSACLNKLYILTGGPGVGKTTTANTIIRLFKAMGKNVVLAAPTGRAAQRLSEVSGEEAKTIHRLLEWSAIEFCFKKNIDNKLGAQVIIVDEASMLDVRLACSLIAAIAPSAQLILIGDVDQLPPVGPGNVLRDLIKSRSVPFTVLQTVFRQAQTSRIVQAAHHINSGMRPVFSDEPGSDCRFIEVSSEAELIQQIQDLLKIHLPEAGYHSVQDVQILTPMNRGELGSLKLNEKAQLWLNPQGKTSQWGKRGIALRQDDKVIQNVNNYDLGVFNGDIGTIRFTHVEGGKVLVSFGEREVYYESEQVQDLALAYSITIHKSQGSEFPVVIIPMTMSHYVMLQRNLIYTALTRAKSLAIFVGEKKALAHAIRNETSAARQTLLASRLESSSPSSLACLPKQELKNSIEIKA